MDSKIGFIGSGRMATALIQGLCRANPSPAICVCGRHPESADALAQGHGIQNTQTITQTAHTADILILAIKPKHLDDLSDADKTAIGSAKYLISLLAGVKLDALQGYFPQAKHIIRLMPNTPVQIRQGTLLHASLNGAPLAESIQTLFNTWGRSFEIPETAFNALTLLSGCGPALVFEFARLLTLACDDLGQTPEIPSTDICLHMLAGSAQLAQSDPTQELQERVKEVAPPGGVTEKLLNALQKANLSDTIRASFKDTYNNAFE